MSECPCEAGSAPPAFVGTNYVCESAQLGSGSPRVYDNNDVLFDGLAIDTPSCVGSFESAPDFQVSVGAPTTEDLQVHVMMSQAKGDEDLAIIFLDLWTR